MTSSVLKVPERTLSLFLEYKRTDYLCASNTGEMIRSLFGVQRFDFLPER
jgi:hypothetical protein